MDRRIAVGITIRLFPTMAISRSLKSAQLSSNFSRDFSQALPLIRQFIDHAIKQQNDFHYILLLLHDFMINAREI